MNKDPIDIGNDLGLTGDKYQLILWEKKIIEKGDRAGETSWKEYGSYPQLEILSHELFTRRMCEATLKDEINSLVDLRNEMKAWAKGFEANLETALKHLLTPKKEAA